MYHHTIGMFVVYNIEMFPKELVGMFVIHFMWYQISYLLAAIGIW
jgi:hypothetical protein